MTITIADILAVLRVIPYVKRILPRLTRKKDTPIGYVISSNNYFDEIGEIEYECVIWRVSKERIETGHRVHYLTHANPLPRLPRIDVSSVARCPRKDCRTILEEHELPWYRLGKFKWLCVSCGFSKTSKLSMYDTSRRAWLIVESKFRP